MMRLKLDENLGRVPLELFRDGGHDVLSVPDQRLAGTADRALIDVCAREERALVTLDIDFANPVVFPPDDHGGVAVLRLPPNPVHQDLVDVCKTLLQALHTGDLTRALWVVRKGRVRVYDKEDRP